MSISHSFEITDNFDHFFLKYKMSFRIHSKGIISDDAIYEFTYRIATGIHRLYPHEKIGFYHDHGEDMLLYISAPFLHINELISIIDAYHMSYNVKDKIRSNMYTRMYDEEVGEGVLDRSLGRIMSSAYKS